MPKQGFRLAFEGKCRLRNKAFYALELFIKGQAKEGGGNPRNSSTGVLNLHILGHLGVHNYFAQQRKFFVQNKYVVSVHSKKKKKKERKGASTRP